MEALHPNLELVGSIIRQEMLEDSDAREVVAYLKRGLDSEVRLVECRQGEGCTAVLIEIKPERPQMRAVDIRRWEPILLVFRRGGGQPRILAARADFPHTPHQYFVPPGGMRSLCVDERPWEEARGTWTALSFLHRIRRWLGAAAAGELTGEGEAIEPYFLGTLAGIVLPATIFNNASASPSIRAWLPDTPVPRLILTEVTASAGASQHQFRVLTIPAGTQEPGSMRNAPRDLRQLDAELKNCGIHILPRISDELIASLAAPSSLEARLIVVVAIPISRGGGAPEMVDVKAFLANVTLGEIGCRLGVLDTAAEGGRRYVRAIGLQRPVLPEEIPVHMLQVHKAFDGDFAAQCSGLDIADRRRITLIGAGAMGSHVSMTLARQGSFLWNVIDDDILHPHNLARHTLLPADLGQPKAIALAKALSGLAGAGTAQSLVVDFHEARHTDMGVALEKALASADLILDASASLAVASGLADDRGPRARCASAFLNPQGTSSVLLMEDVERMYRLDALEAQYYRSVLREPALTEHLAAPASGFRYAGACRSVTNRIPESNVALLGAAVAGALPKALSSDAAKILIWSLSTLGSVEVHSVHPAPVHESSVGDWRVIADDVVIQSLSELRDASLPQETGGILLGTVDTKRKAIVIADLVHFPEGSIGSETSFQRGAVDLPAVLNSVATRTGGQLRYVGEWHSHPRHHSSAPSKVDCEQLSYLRSEMDREGLPALMMIAGSSEVAVVGVGPDA